MNTVVISAFFLTWLLLIEASRVERHTVRGIDAIRLTGQSEAYTGLVEVLSGGVWGLVCNDGFDNNAARVVCRSLGLPNVLVGGARLVQVSIRSSLHIMLDDVNCTGSEASLSECQHRPIGSHNCGLREAVFVTCGQDNSTITALSARLVDGPSRGRVELLMNGIWGTMCSSGNIGVICKMLGFRTGYSIGYIADIDSPGCAKGDGPIHMVTFRCYGHERNLGQCSQTPRSSCDHANDQCVVCG